MQTARCWATYQSIGAITYVGLSVASAVLIVVDLVRRGRAGDAFAWALFAIVTVPIRTLDFFCGLRVAMEIGAETDRPFVHRTSLRLSGINSLPGGSDP